MTSLLILSAPSCQHHNSWKCQQIREKFGNTTRMVYHAKDQVGGIDMEMIQMDGELITYLAVHSFPLFPKEENPHKIDVILSHRGGQCAFTSDLHQGGQKIKLGKKCQVQLISVLQSGDWVTIDLPGYRETIEPEDFDKVLQKLGLSPTKFSQIFSP